ncbi:MAG: hypothetical protein U0797_04385 [Gemmataceae bacterium]
MLVPNDVSSVPLALNRATAKYGSVVDCQLRTLMLSLPSRA